MVSICSAALASLTGNTEGELFSGEEVKKANCTPDLFLLQLQNEWLAFIGGPLGQDED